MSSEKRMFGEVIAGWLNNRCGRIIKIILFSILLLFFLSSCGNENSNLTNYQDTFTPFIGLAKDGTGLSVLQNVLWDRSGGRDLVWTSVSLKDAAGKRVTGLTVNDFEVTETLLDSNSRVVAGPALINFDDPGSYSQFYGDGFWERTVTDEKLDILFIIDRSGSMSGEMPAIQSELHDFVDRLEENHIDFRMAAIMDEWTPGSHKILPSDENAPFPFSGVMEAAEIHDWIDSSVTSIGEWWCAPTIYDTLMLATQFDWRTEPDDVRKVIVIITDTVPQSVYGTFWYLDSTAANRTAAELALEDKGFEVYFSQPVDKAGVMEHPDMDQYTDSDFNPKAGCTQLPSGEWDCGFATIGNHIDWPFDQEQIELDGNRDIVDSQYYFAWGSSISPTDISGNPEDHTVRITIRTEDPDNPGNTLEQSFYYVPVLETTELRVKLTEVHDNPIEEDVTLDVYQEMGDRRVMVDWGYQNQTTPGQIVFTLVPIGDYNLYVRYGWGAYGYGILYYEGKDYISLPGSGLIHDWQLQTGAVDIELAKARGLVQDLKYWGVTEKHFSGFAAAAENWLDNLERNGIGWTEMERIKRFYVALSGYVNASGYAEVEARRLTEDFEQVLLKFRDIIERVRDLSNDSKVVLGISLGEAVARLDLTATAEVVAAKVSVEALKEFAEEELVPLLIDKMIELIPAGDYQSLLSTMVNNLILGHWDDWPELLETIGELALNQALDEVKDQVLNEITDQLFDTIDVPDEAQAAIPYIQQIIESYADNGYDGIEQTIGNMASQLRSMATSPQQIAQWVDDIFFAVHDELAAGPVRDFVLPMMQLIVRSAVLQQEIDDDVVIGVLANLFTHQVIVKPYFGNPVAGHLDDALSKVQIFTPTVVDDWDWERHIAMDSDFAAFRTATLGSDGYDGMGELNDDAWDALRQQDLIDDMATVLDTLADIVDTFLYPLFGGLCMQGYPTCAMMDDLSNFTAALDAIGLMTKVIELSLKTEDLIELKDDVAFINNLVLVEP